MKTWKDKCLFHCDLLAMAVQKENYRQLDKWDVQERTPFEWLAYLTEEIGELAQAISENEYRDGKKDNIFTEAIQVATLALKIAEMSRG
jgi:NTP pyrophosphatase (non-canonical NTP hydrolase)